MASKPSAPMGTKEASVSRDAYETRAGAEAGAMGDDVLTTPPPPPPPPPAVVAEEGDDDEVPAAQPVGCCDEADVCDTCPVVCSGVCAVSCELIIRRNHASELPVELCPPSANLRPCRGAPL